LNNPASKEFDLFITDLNGNLRGKRLPVSSIDKVRREGVKLPRSVVGLDLWGADVLDSGLVFETGDGDGVCWPVSEEPVPIPWAESARSQVLAMMSNADGSPFEVDPRQVLCLVLERFRALGLKPVVAAELEFYLMDGKSETGQRPIPPAMFAGRGSRLTQSGGYAVDVLDGFSQFLADVRRACEIQGIPADTIIAEMGPGQFEINLAHVDNVLTAADHAVLYKRLVKGVARRHGYAATFMAKPYVDQSGNGFHVHFSLLDEKGRNVFDDGSDKGSKFLLRAVAGLMQTMSDSMLFFAPHANSYRRFLSQTHAPTYASWGYDNRTVAIRIPESPNPARRLEHRVAGADANPYLVLASVLAGALYGMEEKLMPNQPISGDAYAESEEGSLLPCSWRAATATLERSDVLQEYLGEQFVRVFLAVKRQEQRKLGMRISDVEYEAYLNLL